MLNGWTQRLRNALGTRRAAPLSSRVAAGSTSRRAEVCPPERLYRLSQWRSGLHRWLHAGWEAHSAPPRLDETQAAAIEAISLTEAREEFTNALQDIDSDNARGLRYQIERARSPRELWHLRSGLYSLVATHHSESQAQLRLERLNRHFTPRAMRTLFGAR
jgi:hypothetical protein